MSTFPVQHMRAARGNARHCKAAWKASVAQHKADDKVLTIEELLHSEGTTAGVKRFETALAPTPTGQALRSGHSQVHHRSQRPLGKYSSIS